MASEEKRDGDGDSRKREMKNPLLGRVLGRAGRLGDRAGRLGDRPGVRSGCTSKHGRERRRARWCVDWKGDGECAWRGFYQNAEVYVAW